MAQNNLRIVYDNVVDSATLTALSEVGTLLVGNLQTNKKSEVWRSAGTYAEVTATWTEDQIVSMVAFPFCNLTTTSTIRVRGYALAGDSVPVYDSGAVPANAYAPMEVWDWGTTPLGVNAYTYGGGTYSVLYFPAVTVRKLVVDFVDTDNTSGYIEAARFVAGSYWSPTYNADYGAPITAIDTSKQERSDSGDMVTNRGVRYRKMSLTLGNMPAGDRQKVMDILRGNGMIKPFFVSLYPEDADLLKEQTYQMFGKLPLVSPITSPAYAAYATTIEIEEF